MSDEAANREAFRIQQRYCEAMEAPLTAAVCAALAEALDRSSLTGARVLDWSGEPTQDALPLRLVGGLHALAQAGDTALAPVFAGEVRDTAELERTLAAALHRHDATLLHWLEGPPQTNEAGRSGALMAGLLRIAQRFGPDMEILEIGSSAGMNLLIDRYRYELGNVLVGPSDSLLTIRPDWRGPPPPAVPIRFVRARGVDVQPIDVCDPEQARRLRGYVWADQPDRLARMDVAVTMLCERPVDLARGDAAEWLEARLAEPQPAGVTRVLMHSVVWQYLGEARQARITAAMEDAGARATPERPLAWVVMEPERALLRQEVRVRHWPEGAPWMLIATAHAHGAWVETLP